MLELESVSWRNFLSYPDEVTSLPINTLGQCLITGEVIEEDFRSDVPIKRSNGAGKSTIPSVIQWVLFGRTMHAVQPGNKVVNWFTKKDCWAKIIFKNGDSITRTRNVGGHNELIYVKNGDENTLVSDTQSTTKLQQAQLAKEFKLDWEVFCGSVFFNQYGKPWMEMPDAARKKAIERILHVDKFTYRAKVAKSKLEAVNKYIDKLRADLEARNRENIRLETDIQRIKNAGINFVQNQKQRQLELLRDAKQEKEDRDRIVVSDDVKLQARWDVVTKIEQKIEELEKEERKLRKAYIATDDEAKLAQKTIDLWQKKAGKICLECEQSVPDEHVGGKIAPFQKKVDAAKAEAIKLKDQWNKKNDAITKTKELIESKKPNMTMSDWMRLQKDWQQHDKEFKRLMNTAKKITGEVNPHTESSTDAEQKLESCTTKIIEIEKDIQRYDYQARHYQYIYKAYNDRTKIKSYVFQEHIPFINSRLRHYLDIFGLDVWIELTPSLGIKSNMWGYEFESGGERKRTDVAFMFAIFDFHEQMYGRQCNLLVLDEVDGRLDDDGIDALISIIKDDLASKVETILIISHRTNMHDVFPREIKVTRQNRISQLQVN